MRFQPVLATFATLLLGATAAVAGPILTPASQSREIETIALVTGESEVNDNDFDSAAAFDPFSSSVFSSAQLGDPPNTVSATADSNQQSSVLPTALLADGFADGITSIASPGFSPSASGRSFFSVTFSLPGACAFTLDGQLDATADNGDALASVLLYNDDLAIPVYSNFTLDGSMPFATLGVLAAGKYSLIANAEAITSNDDQNVTAGYSVEFHLVPEPATALLLLVGALAARRVTRL